MDHNSRNRGIHIAVSLKTKFERHFQGEFHDCSWVFWSCHCSRKGARRAEEEVDFHRFQVRHFSNNFEQSPCYCKMGATPDSRFKCLWTYKIPHQAKYQRLNANTLYVAAILFFRSTLHYRASLILSLFRITTCDQCFDMHA